jgi:type IV pilus assembly protein PilQ
MRFSAGLLWRGPVLAAAAWMLTACATEMEEVQAPPASPLASPAPAPPPPAPPAPSPAVVAPSPSASPTAPTPAAPTPPPAVASPPPALPAPSAQAARGLVEVTGVEVQDAGSGGLVLLVTGDGPITTYESFTLPDPPRLVVDIPNAIHAVPQPISARLPLVTAIRSSQYRERPVQIVRVVFDLRSALPYRVVATQNQLRVDLGMAAAGAPTTPTPSVAPPAPPPAAARPAGKVTRVDLQNVRGRQQILIRTTGPVMYTVTESSDPLGLSIDVIGATVEPAASRTVDLRQVASPVSRLQTSQRQTAPAPVVRVVADLRGPTRYDVRQTPSAIVVEFLNPPRTAQAPAAPAAIAAVAGSRTPTPGAPTALAAAPPVAGASPAVPGTGRLSMDFKDADVNNLLRIIAEVSGMNVVAGGDVTGKVTVRLVNVDWQQALDVILRINGMGYEIDGNIIRVAPLAKLAAEQQARETAKVRKEEKERKDRADALKEKADELKGKKEEKLDEPLMDEVVSVNYAKASEVVKNLDRLKTQGRPEVGIVVDDRTNKLIIRETAGALAKMKDLLLQLDRPTPQVLIEARLVEATRNFSQSLGIEWGFSGNAGLANLQQPPVSIFSSGVGSAIAVPTTPIPLSISMPATGPTAAIGVIANSLFSNRLALSARISAGEAEGKARTLSAPKVATLDNQEAEIKQGQQVPYTTVDSSGRTVIAFADAFIRLKVTPHITNDRRVSMKVEAERSFPGDVVNYSGGFVYPINTRKATTNVLVANGSTIVIGGLLQTDERWAESRVPWLSKVPMLGALFKNTSIGPEQKVELLIFLTPTILEEAKVS